MTTWVAERRAGTAPDRLFLLTHPPVITYGRTTAPSELPTDPNWLPLVQVDRGGHATYHGPGQLIGYLAMALPRPLREAPAPTEPAPPDSAATEPVATEPAPIAVAALLTAQHREYPI